MYMARERREEKMENVNKYRPHKANLLHFWKTRKAMSESEAVPAHTHAHTSFPNLIKLDAQTRSEKGDIILRVSGREREREMESVCLELLSLSLSLSLPFTVNNIFYMLSESKFMVMIALVSLSSSLSLPRTHTHFHCGKNIIYDVMMLLYQSF
jgi:hypothetical protein